jgi:poly(3-hydroxybutyrate) depolymerase
MISLRSLSKREISPLDTLKEKKLLAKRERISADGYLWPSAPSPFVALYKIEGGGHVVPQPVLRYPLILGHTTTAVDMPKLMIEMFHISSK